MDILSFFKNTFCYLCITLKIENLENLITKGRPNEPPIVYNWTLLNYPSDQYEKCVFINWDSLIHHYNLWLNDNEYELNDNEWDFIEDFFLDEFIPLYYKKLLLTKRTSTNVYNEYINRHKLT